MATSYRYLFADVLTNQILAELPLTGVAFTQQLNQAGTFSGHLLVSGINAATQNLLNATIPGRCAVYVDRSGVLVWGGIIWSREYDSTSQHVKISAREWESYFERRRITSDLFYSNVDQLAVAQSLVNTAQAVPFGNIGVTVGTETSGVLISKNFYAYERKTYFQALQDISRALNGFDFNVNVSYDSSGLPQKTLLLGYPRIGNTYSVSSISVPVFELPGNMVEYVYPEDGTIAANTIYALGAGTNEGKLIATASDTTKTAAGWPLLEDAANYSDVADATLLQNLASGQVQAVSYPPTTLRVTVPPFQDPIFGTYSIGDQARVRILDAYFTSELDTNYRIVGLSVQPGENGPERATITLTSTSN